MKLPKTHPCDSCGKPASRLAGRLPNGLVACSAKCAEKLQKVGS